MTSIRRTLARTNSIVVFIVVAALCTGGFAYLRHWQLANFHKAIEMDLRVVANSVKVWTNGDIYMELNASLLREFDAGGPSAFVIRDMENGDVIAKSESLYADGRGLKVLPGASPDRIIWGEDMGSDGGAATVATQILPAQWGWDMDDPTIEPDPGVRDTMVEITVAHDRSMLERVLFNLALAAFAISTAAALAAGLATWAMTGRALRPLDRLAQKAAEIDEPTDLAPFEVTGPAEIVPIADRLNDLLTRLFMAARRERRFTADAAHELRTPIAELRTLTDVALAFPDDPDRLQSVVRTSNELSVRLTSLVDALLGLTRRETIMNDLRMAPVDIPALLQRLIDARHQAITERGLTLHYRGPDEHLIDSDVALLTSVLTNLIGNAVDYAPQGAEITLTYSGGSDGFRLDVTNPAPDLGQADLAQLFQPFWRKRGTQSDRAHSGLGLTLSQNFADILGMDLSANLLTSGNLQLTLSK
ncbi:sensor histidine kinase [Loktanella agnita]|uniref:sensor histidine kinase n=1 Tax=Loktanella agnita TaxID=287097 RepID=UPI003987838C